MAEKKRSSPRRLRVLSVSEAAELFLTARGGKEQSRLTALWSHWELVLGAELASLAAPLGHKGTVLNVGAEDTMAMQEITLQSDDILERANAFMDSAFFDRLKVHLLQGQRPLSRKPPVQEAPLRPLLPPRPPRLGSLLGRLDPDSPVTRCYEAYVRLFHS